MGGAIDQLKKAGFSRDQIEQIGLGRKSGVDVSVYAYPYFPAIQMYQLRLALEEHLPIENYASREYDWFQIEEIRKGFLSKVDIERYAHPSIPFDVMRQIRLGLEEGVDLSPFKGLPAGVLREVRLSLISGVKIVPFISAGYSEEQLEEIRLSLEHKVKISPYLNKLFRADSLREIGEGLEKGLDVSVYAKIDFDWHQMHEIRLGLEEGVPPEVYANLMYTAREMNRRRLDFLEKSGKLALYNEAVNYTGEVAVAISTNDLEASLIFKGNKKKWTEPELRMIIKAGGVTYGVIQSALDDICRREVERERVVVAKGLPPESGKDGWYEYFFKTPIEREPKVLRDGSLDYQSVGWFVFMQKGQRLAVYHSAQKGVSGMSVTGKEILAESGKELKVLGGSGFLVSKDKKTYVSGMDGEVSLENGQLRVKKLLVLSGVARRDGDVDAEGSVLIHGNVESGVTVSAKGDIVVEGNVRGADLRAGGNIFLKKGCNAMLGRGRLYAEGDIIGSSFTEAIINTKQDFLASICLGCKIEAESRVRIAGAGSNVTGGTVFGAFGVDARSIGSTGGASALIMTGLRPDFYMRVQEVHNNVSRVNKELELLSHTYDTMKNRLTPGERSKDRMFITLEKAIYTKELEKKDLEQQKMILSSEEKSFANSYITVHETLHEGTDIDISGTRTKTKVDMHNVTLKKSRGIIIATKNG